MPESSTKTRMVSFRLSNEAYDEISRLIISPTNLRQSSTSVGGYCKQVIERYAFRHDKKGEGK